MTLGVFHNIDRLEASLWEAADQLRANSKLTSSEYCMPVLGVIFLRHASNRYEAARCAIEADQAAGNMPKRPLRREDFIKRRALMLPEQARYDYCCAKEGCRRRTTPPSVRFLGQRVYLGAVVVLVLAMQGVTVKRAEQLRDLLGVSWRTLKRWRRWWRGAFVASPFWKQAKGRFTPPVEVAALPASLFERFMGQEVQARLIKVLHFLIPMTAPTKSGLVDGGF